jgi:hypothetical protein
MLRTISGMDTGRRWHVVELEQEKEKETAQPAELEVSVPREDHPEQEDCKTHHREPLSMQPDTELQCSIMKCIIRIMHINV